MQLNHNGSVTSPKGFRACGITAGLKKSGKADMALICSDVPCVTAAAFTSNLFAAAPVVYDRETLARCGQSQAVIINSGNANACTGEQGLKDARRMAELTASRLGLDPDRVLVSSTGIIGQPMPWDIISHGIELATSALSYDGGITASEAIMTTDTVAKHVSISLELGGKTVTIGGMTKGSGMIAPLMRPCRVKQATMLSYITTDACISQDWLATCLARSLDDSYNRIVIDGDMSTNDTLVALANGQAGNPLLCAGTPEAEAFRQAFRAVVSQLAREMVLDGEGVTKFVELNISGALDNVQARRIAEAIARSPLCKTAWYGNDPNWGRILDAAGYSGANFRPQDVSLDINGTPFVQGGMGAGHPQAELEAAVRPREMRIDLRVGEGIGAFTIWTCDLSHDYVKINADYHT